MRKAMKGKAATKRAAKEAIKDKFRRSKRIAEKKILNYYQAHRGQGDVVPFPNPDHERIKIPGLLPKSEVTIPVCDGIGQCCRNKMFMVEPGDVFRIFKNQKVVEKWGIKTTADLYGEGKPLSYFVAKGMPLCAVNKVPVPDSQDQWCPFHQDQGCMLGDDRLTYCLSSPVGRSVMAPKEEGGDLVWYYDVDNEQCEGCPKAAEKTSKKVGQHLFERGISTRIEDTNHFSMIIAMTLSALNKIEDEQERGFGSSIISTCLYDWHTALITFAGVGPDDVLEQAPSSVSSLMQGMKMIISLIPEMAAKTKADRDRG